MFVAIEGCIERLLKRGGAIGLTMTSPPQLVKNLLQFRKASSAYQCAITRYLSVAAVILPGSVKSQLEYLCEWALEGVWSDHAQLSKVRG